MKYFHIKTMRLCYVLISWSWQQWGYVQLLANICQQSTMRLCLVWSADQVNNEVMLGFNQLMRDEVSTHLSASSTLGSASWTGCCCAGAGRETLVVTLSSRARAKYSDQIGLDWAPECRMFQIGDADDNNNTPTYSNLEVNSLVNVYSSDTTVCPRNGVARASWSSTELL